MSTGTRHDVKRALRISRTAMVLFAGPAILLLPGTTGCNVLAARPVVVVEREEWSFGPTPGTTLKTRHYQLHTTCTDRVFLELAPRVLESALIEYQKLIPLDAPLGDRMKIYLFASRMEWERFTRQTTGPRAATYLKIRSGGYEEGGITVLHYSRRGPTLSILAHEGLHQYLTMTGRRGVPAWLNEGLACYFEAFDLDKHDWPVFDPHANTIRRQNLREALEKNRIIPLAELLTMDAGSAVRGGEVRTQSYYAQLWGLMLYLQESPRVNPDAVNFRRLLAEIGTDQMREAGRLARTASSATDDQLISADEAVFRFYITHDLDGFESRYRAYLRQLAGL